MKIRRKELRQHVNKIITLPTLPHVIGKLAGVLENPMVSAEEVNTVISSDQVLTAKVLRLVNSAFYGFPGQISSVTHAIVILGFTTIRSVALSASVFDVFSLNGGSIQFDRRKFWQHAVGTAVISKAIAHYKGYPEEEDAFVAGLLHDIGKIIIDQCLHDLFMKIIKEVYDNDILFIEAEEKFMDCNHQHLGKWLSENWKLPVRLREAIAHHHNPERAREGYQLACFVHLADILCRAKKIGCARDTQIPKISHKAWHWLGLQEPELLELFELIDLEIDKAQIFFDIINKKSKTYCQSKAS
ncbi:HDOD domain-containing protein [bacterium]|nr:HDOD domain-containing protein [bacterium]